MADLSPRQPIFYDPGQQRWPRVRGGLVAVVLILSALLSMLAISIVYSPPLSQLGLEAPEVASAGPHLAPPTSQAQVDASFSDMRARLMLERNKKRPPPPLRQSRQSSAPLTAAFFVNWDDSSLSSLKENLETLDILIPEWLHLNCGVCELNEDNPARQKDVLEYVRLKRPELRLMPLVNNYVGQGWQGEQSGALVMNPTARKRAIELLLSYCERHPCSGLTIDFEDLPIRAIPMYYQFLFELGVQLHAKKMLLAVTAPLDSPAHNYRRLSTVADYVVLLAYDQHWSGAEPGPIAAMDWFRKGLQLRQADVPNDKTIVAIGNYSYDWRTGRPAAGRNFDDMMIIARENRADIRTDPASLNPAFRYEDEKGRQHDVWMLDATTFFNHLSIAGGMRPRGFALWRLGSEDPALWRVFGKGQELNAEAAAKLSEMSFRFGIDFSGEGEIIRVAQRPQSGKREITFDAQTRLITAETFASFPSPYVIRRYGSLPKKIALTFDDGPSSEYTSAILDILKQEQVPAAFFVVGSQAELHPDLVRRIVDEGHEIGNHTFTHPNIAMISPLQLKLELSATQRLVESLTGRQTALFRPPYGEDSDPSTADEIQPLEVVGEQGYVTVGMHVDPHDWKSPEPDEICRRIVEQADRGEGQIVLLHDGGGERANTVKMLPQAIATLREHGYTFCSVAQLLGKTRDEVMPPLAATRRASAFLNRAAFSAINWCLRVLQWLFLAGIGLGVMRLAATAMLAVLGYWRKKRQRFSTDYLPSVAVIVPAYNEEKVIVQTVHSLLESDYPKPFEIIVVDDGSPDYTFIRVQKEFADEPRVHIYKKPNAGKSNALNFGIECTQAEIIIAMDADTVFQKDTISKLVRHFEAPGVGAVAGNAKVGNRINLLTRWQALEYVTSQNLDRRAFEVLNCITVVPGAVGAWRRKLVVEAGGFTRETLAEDADLTIGIRRLGYRITYEDEAIARTEAPDSIRQFVKQRYRWMYGTLQAGWKHKDTLLRPSHGALGFVALPNIFIFQVFFPLISPVMDLLTLGSLGGVLANKYLSLGSMTPQSAAHIFWFYALFVAVDYLAATIAFILEPREDKKLLFWLFWQRFFYRQLMYYVAIKSTFASLRGIAVGWGALERKATVKMETAAK
ncbi:MAG TPA: polysaccharide deacetylase family protein [Planctomycetota bacterium]|jgi:cellulose synthase/poly-beta-1,6-N-acetylglucosamine synthase-like glycosyltransferase/peptidoglycan/xylan/chitin deacetylase (PgdA/CDA1 family)/spore germination protein YaaH